MIPEKPNPNGNFPTTITDENKGSGLIIDAVQQDPSNRRPDGYHRCPHEDCERVTDTSSMERCPNGFHRNPDGDCERRSDYNRGNEKYYRYYYDDNDDNDIKIIKKSTK